MATLISTSHNLRAVSDIEKILFSWPSILKSNKIYESKEMLKQRLHLPLNMIWNDPNMKYPEA